MIVSIIGMALGRYPGTFLSVLRSSGEEEELDIAKEEGDPDTSALGQHPNRTNASCMTDEELN